MLGRLHLAIASLALVSCAPRSPDFTTELNAPSGTTVATLAGYQPRGTVEGYLTITLAKRGDKPDPQLTFGHMLNVHAGWIDGHTLALVYDALEPRHTQSPIYPTGQVESAVEVVTCNSRYLDCSPLLRRLAKGRALFIKQFPEGDWPFLS